VICLIVVGCAVAMGATCAAVKPFGDLDKARKIVKVVTAFYKGCESREASVVMAELAIVDLAKKNDKDALPYLQRALKEVKDETGLRNFTTFLIANCHKERGDVDAAMETALSVIAEGEKGVVQIEKVEKEESPQKDK
jgi:predicted negative regulator of RcsB-dependent stress response